MVAKKDGVGSSFLRYNLKSRAFSEDVKLRAMTPSSRQGTDYPNQVNNVLCFRTPQALVAGASTITIEMEIAAVHAIAELARPSRAKWWRPPSAKSCSGPDYLIPAV
jgi:malate dehydrogenase (oxaloacetate-decarboxylating)(NADP+)